MHYSLGIVAYRLIKQATDGETLLAGQKTLSCNEAQTRTHQLLDNCIELSGEETDSAVDCLRRIKGCCNQENMQNLPIENNTLKSLIDDNDQSFRQLYEKLCARTKGQCPFYNFFEAKVVNCLPCITKIFAIKLKESDKLKEFEEILGQENVPENP